MLSPQLDFQSTGRVQFRVSLASTGRYYGELHEFVAMNHSATAAVAVQLTRSTSFSLSPSVSYSPTLFSGVFDGIGVPSTGDNEPLPVSNYLLNSNRSYVYGGAANLTHQFTARAAMVFDAGFRYTDFTRNEAGYTDVRSSGVGGTFTYSTSRNVKLRFGYRMDQGQYAGFPQSTQHNLDLGVDYTKPISRTRNTAINISIGPVVGNAAVSSNQTQELQPQLQFVVNSSVRHQLGRTWVVQGGYRRGVGYFQGFQAPSFTGAYTANAGGFLNLRTDTSFSAAYSSGESIYTGVPSRFTTYTADTQLRLALTRHWAAYVAYSLYDYRFDQSMPLPPSVPPGLKRNTVRTGLTLWIPVRHR